METKKYYAESMPTAMEQIKRELGADAIIIKSRKIKQKYGPLGLFRKSMYEVVVSCEEVEPQSRREVPWEASARASFSPTAKGLKPEIPKLSDPLPPKEKPEPEPEIPLVQPEHFAHLMRMSNSKLEAQEDQALLKEAAISGISEQPMPITPASKLGAYAASTGSAKAQPILPAEQFKPAPIPTPAPAPTPAPTAAQTQAPAPAKRGRGRPRKNSGAQTNPPAAKTPPQAESSPLQRETMVRLAAMENMIQELHRKLTKDTPPADAPQPETDPTAWQEKPPQELPLAALLQRLAEQDVDSTALEVLKEDAQELLHQDDSLTDYDAIYQALETMLGKPRYVRASKKKPRCILFIGPTGVGKTTTLVKLISSCVFERGATAAIINADVFRVGAQDQLSAYAGILNVPLSTIYHTNELEQSIEQFADYDFIFIDTSGRAPQDAEYQAELRRLIDTGKISEIYLTVSSTTSGRACRRIAKEYAGLGQFRILVTKLDESESYGAVVNLCHACNQPISYITVGQSVPDDIRRANTSELIELLLR